MQVSCNSKVQIFLQYFVDNLKPANMQISCNIQKPAKNTTGLFGFVNVTTYLHVFIQHVMKII